MRILLPNPWSLRKSIDLSTRRNVREDRHPLDPLYSLFARVDAPFLSGYRVRFEVDPSGLPPARGPVPGRR